MCRFVSYIGEEIGLDDLLFKPGNSLVSQSRDAKESSVHVNGDGFGLGWYVDEKREPALFKSRYPAWNDSNLKRLAEKLSSFCIMGHVRSATEGALSLLNCHPFNYDNLLMLHNGTIHGFKDIMRPLRAGLCDPAYHWIGGQTDSEHLFALFLHQLLQKKAQIVTVDLIAMCLTEAIRHVERLMSKYAKNKVAYINAVISDGRSLVATRYVSDSSCKARSMHFTTGSSFECIEDQLYVHRGNGDYNMILVASEVLSEQSEYWHDVEPNQMLIYQVGSEPRLVAI